LNKHITILFILFFSSFTSVNSAFSQSSDSTTNVEVDTSHTARKATILSAVIPGAGQIYNNLHRPITQKNRLWWKLPIIYGGLGASTYMYFENQKTFKEYRNLRLELLEGNTTIPYSDQQLSSIEEQYRKWRDLSIISGLAVYLLNVIDANVEGTLLHFDNSDDLSLNISPYFPVAQQTYAGVKLSINF